MIRVLVVDDSPTARGLLVEVLRGAPGIEVVGEAKDGAEAVEATRKLRPDVVTMDIDMPRMDGVAATREIMIESPTPIVVVTGSLAPGEVAVSMQALHAGAVSVLCKPSGVGAPGHREEAQQLVDTVTAMADVKVIRRVRPGQARTPAALERVVGRHNPPQVVAIAASTGGPAALHQLLSALPEDFPLPILVVQHMSAGFISGLATSLNGVGGLHVKVAVAAEPLAPRTVYLAPDAGHLGVLGRSAVGLSHEPPVGGFRPSGTFLFESVARAFGAGVVGVILTGMGADGVAGLKVVKEVGGYVLAQDQETSVVFGMPAAAAAEGLADRVLPLDRMAGALVGLLNGGRP